MYYPSNSYWGIKCIDVYLYNENKEFIVALNPFIRFIHMHINSLTSGKYDKLVHLLFHAINNH